MFFPALQCITKKSSGRFSLKFKAHTCSSSWIRVDFLIRACCKFIKKAPTRGFSRALVKSFFHSKESNQAARDEFWIAWLSTFYVTSSDFDIAKNFSPTDEKSDQIAHTTPGNGKEGNFTSPRLVICIRGSKSRNLPRCIGSPARSLIPQPFTLVLKGGRASGRAWRWL